MPQQLPGGGVLTPIDQLVPSIDLPTGTVQRPREAPRPRPGILETIGAAFEQENTFVSALRSPSDVPINGDPIVSGYSAWDEIKGTPYEDRWHLFTNSRSTAETEITKRRVDEELENRRTLEASGAGGVLASVVAGIVDPTILIPVGGQIQLAGKGTWAISRAALQTATAGGVGTAIQEGVLQGTQVTRTAEEAVFNIGSGIVLSGMLGGGAAALLSRGERKAAIEAMEELPSILRDNSVGAASVDRLSLADLSPSRAEGFGGAADAIASVTRVNPTLRAQYRASPVARTISQQLGESTIYQAMHDRGATLGPAAETLAKVQVQSTLLRGISALDTIWSDAKKGGLGLAKHEFDETVSRAMRRGDVGANDYASRAAEQLRTHIVDPLKNQAIDLGMLPADVDVSTAASYFTRIWNRERLVQQEDVFKRIGVDYYEPQLAREYAADQDALKRRLAAAEEEVADLRLGPDARVQALEEIRTQGELLDATQADQVARVSNINDLRREQRAARQSGDTARATEIQTRIEAEQAAGGERLKSYLADRRRLRARYKRVDLNYAGLNQRYDAVMQSLVDVEEANIASINRVVDKGRRFEREMQKLDPAKIQERISALRGSFMQIAEKADRAADRAAKALQKLRDDEAKSIAEGGKPGKNDKAMAERVEKEVQAQRNRADKMTSLAARLEAAETFDVNASMFEVRQSVDALVNEVSNLSLGRGEKAARLKERLSRLDTSKVDERIAALEEAKAAADAKFRERWEPREDLQGGTFRDEAVRIMDDVFDRLTGRGQTEGSSGLAEYMTPLTRGPMKDRTFTIPDELIEDFLENNVRTVMERYTRTMVADIELTRAFGRADMRDQIQSIRDDYRDIRARLTAASNGEQAVAALPEETRAAFKETLEGKRPSVEKVRKFLDKDEAGAIRDLEAMRDLIRGTYKADANSGDWGRIVRGGMAFNYMRSMGGVLFSNLSEIFRPAMVHGYGPFLAEGIRPLLTNLKAIKLSVEEAQLCGQVAERVLQNRMMSLGEVGDPYRSGTAIERLLQNGARFASQWNGLIYFTDAMKSISSVISQNRILKGVSGEMGDDKRFLAFMGIDSEMAGRIDKEFAAHGETLDGVRVANTEKWADQVAVRTYRAAVSKDVDSIIVTKSVGDVPLMANEPLGKALLQFRGYMFASHQRVLLRGLQESKTNFVSGMVGMSAIGMFAVWARSWRGGKERHDKFMAAAENPGYLIAEGLDLTGIFSLPFELANTTEKITGGAGGINPLKDPIRAAGMLAAPEASRQGESVRYSTRGPLSALAGPTGGLLEDSATTLNAGLKAAQGKEVSQSDRNKAIGLIPYGSYLGMREVLQTTAGDSPYLPEQ